MKHVRPEDWPIIPTETPEFSVLAFFHIVGQIGTIFVNIIADCYMSKKKNKTVRLGQAKVRIHHRYHRRYRHSK